MHRDLVVTGREFVPFLLQALMQPLFFLFIFGKVLPGIGLAAVQVAVPKRVVTMDLAKKEGPSNPQVFINPQIVWRSEETAIYEEGCLSIPEYYEEVERPARVRVRFTDLDGKVHEEDADGLFATCIQHEIDHLNGVLFVDYLSKLKRDRVLKKFAKAAKRAAE